MLEQSQWLKCSGIFEATLSMKYFVAKTLHHQQEDAIIQLIVTSETYWVQWGLVKGKRMTTKPTWKSNVKNGKMNINKISYTSEWVNKSFYFHCFKYFCTIFPVTLCNHLIMTQFFISSCFRLRHRIQTNSSLCIKLTGWNACSYATAKICA